MEASIAQRFKNSISEWMHSPENRGKFSAKMRARVIVDEAEPKLARLFLLDFVERTCRGVERAALHKEGEGGELQEAQMMLLGPGFAELFVSVRERLPLKSGRTKQFVLMTASDIEEAANAVWIAAKKGAAANIEKAERQANYLHQLAREMKPYMKGNPHLTVRDFTHLKASGVEAGSKVLAGKG